jgi:superfamily II DNA or RNA helicase
MKVSKRGECIRKVANYSKQEASDKYDKSTFNVGVFKDKMPITSPKLVQLIKTINDLDKADMQNHMKLFKHIIYTDVKSSAAGSKMLAAGLTAAGFTNVYGKDLKLNVLNNPKKNFALLSSVQVYDKPFPIKLKKSILSVFNQRPENVYGELIRFIILDQGFKEGIDVFDVKYVHLFEPLITDADEKQAIGRGTRFCGQKGLNFDPQTGWPLHVFKYDITMDDKTEMGKFFMQNSGLDLSTLTFAGELEVISKYGAVDYELTKNIQSPPISRSQSRSRSRSQSPTGKSSKSPSSTSSSSKLSHIGSLVYTNFRHMQADDVGLTNKVHNPLLIKKTKAKTSPMFRSVPLNQNKSTRSLSRDMMSIGGGIKGKRKNKMWDKAPRNKKSFLEMRKYIRERFFKYRWDRIKFENKCEESKRDPEDKQDSRIVEYTPTQDFVSRYFNNTSANKGLLLWHSVGTGKTCSAIAVASNGFEPHGYTILWVTRHTLKSDVWKNMFTQVCSASIRRRIINGENIPLHVKSNPLKYAPDNWVIPISYKQFTNMLNEKNDIYKMMRKRNGAEDPLRRTLVVIDEVHKLYSSDLPVAERPNLKVMKAKIKNSYKISGKDSVRLLLMSATPYTTDPMHLIKIINLMNTSDMPETFEEFKAEYLDDNCRFTSSGAKAYLDNISGLISYLNREKDARQFAYPVFHQVRANLSKMDKSNEINLVAEINKVTEELDALEAQLKDIPPRKDMIRKKEIKEYIKDAKQKQKDIKKKLTVAKKDTKDDISQETALNQCLKTKK